MSSISKLPYLPISLSSMQDGPLFSSNDARLVRAAFWMLDAAWKSDVPGSISSSFSSLSMVTRLTESQVQQHYAELTEGWELRDDGRLHHVDLSRLAESIDEQFGAQLDVISSGLVIAMQGVDAFELTPPEAVKKVAKKRGKAQIPGVFQPDVVSVASLIKAGYVTEEYREWVLEQFRDYAQSKALKQANWQATLRTYASSSITASAFRARFGMFPSATTMSVSVIEPQQQQNLRQPSSTLDRLRAKSAERASSSATFAQRTAMHNSNVMANAMHGRATRSDGVTVDSSCAGSGKDNFSGVSP